MDTVVSDKLKAKDGGGEGIVKLGPEKYMCPVSEENADIEAAPAEKAPVKLVKDPGMPSKEEYDEHMATHAPFRSWCPLCTAGKQSAAHTAHAAKTRHSSGDTN